MRALFNQQFLPYQYPVAALVVDDDPPLLDALTAGPSRERRIFSATSGESALDVYARRRAPAAAHRFMRRNRDQTGLTEHNVVVDTRSITSLIDRPERHDEIGLLVVDYKMRGLNGVEVCEALCHEPCRRILLTGTADERIAVQAFNSGLIHQYVRKGPDILERLADVMQREQQHYFHEMSRTLADSLRDRLGAFEQEPAVRDLLQTLIEQLGVAEYYLCTEPNGLMVIDREGQRRRILVQSEQERRSALEILGVSGTEDDLLGAMVYAEPADDEATPPTAWVVRPQLRLETALGRVLVAMETADA
jgi:CheY-like chemotaxis protein